MYKNWWNGEGGDQGMEESHKEAWQNVISLLDVEEIRDKKILDFGCNQGGFLRALYDRIPFQKGAGMDLASEAIKTAQNRVGNYPITYVQTSDPQVFKEAFDTAISTSVLYLIEDLDEHAQVISDALVEGGVYYASFADQSKNPSLSYMKEQIDRYGSTKMQVKTLTEVVDAFVEKGFSVELIKEWKSDRFDVSHYREFYETVDDLIYSYQQSYIIKATKGGRK
ncbi:class I SAM-dependent methyltransferase [Streptococcus cameli]